jgi:hypothetical protein
MYEILVCSVPRARGHTGSIRPRDILAVQGEQQVPRA